MAYATLLRPRGALFAVRGSIRTHNRAHALIRGLARGGPDDRKDPHKGSPTAVAIDAAESQLGTLRCGPARAGPTSCGRRATHSPAGGTRPTRRDRSTFDARARAAAVVAPPRSWSYTAPMTNQSQPACRAARGQLPPSGAVAAPRRRIRLGAQLQRPEPWTGSPRTPVTAEPGLVRLVSPAARRCPASLRANPAGEASRRCARLRFPERRTAAAVRSC
jgi:hypothetical protein